MKQLSIILLTCLVCLVLATGCGKDDKPSPPGGGGTPKVEPEDPVVPEPVPAVKVNVGVVVPTGEGSAAALQMKKGLAACIEENQPADARRVLELVEVSLEDLAAQVGDKDIDVIVGGTTQADAAAIARVATRLTVPAVLAVAPEGNPREDVPWSFVLAPTPEGMARGLARYMNDNLSASRLAVVIEDTDGQFFEMADAWQRVLSPAAPGDDSRIVSKQTVSRTDQLQRAVRRAAYHNADVIFVSASETMLVQLAAARGEGGPTVAAVLGYTDPSVFGSEADNILLAAFSASAGTDTVTGSPSTVLGYDAGAVILNATVRAIEPTPELLRDALATTRDVQGYQAPGQAEPRLMTFDRNGYASGRQFWIGRIKQGRVTWEKQVKAMVY